MYRVYSKEYFEKTLVYSLEDKGYMTKFHWGDEVYAPYGRYVIMRESNEHLDYVADILVMVMGENIGKLI